MNVTDVAAITDTEKRLHAASALVRKAEAKIEEHRANRDLAVLVMLRPFADAVAETNAQRARLREQRDAGEITHDEYTAGLATNREQRQADLRDAGVTVQPVHVYESLHVARNVVNRILMRMPVEPLPYIANPEAVAKRAQRRIPEWEKVLSEAREIRDTAALLLLSGEARDAEDRPVLRTNAEVARATGLTTARIAQLREGV